MRKIKSITTVNIHLHSGWLFFFGYNPNIFSNAQVRLLLTYRRALFYTLPVNGSLGSKTLN